MSAQIALRVALLTSILALAPASRAQSYFFAVDVPTEVAGTRLASETIHVKSTSRYYPMLGLPLGVAVSALHRDDTGIWSFTPRTPVDLDGTLYGPDDIVATDGASYASVFDGQAAGLPEGVAIDAILVGSGGGLIISLDTPAEWGGFTFFPSDLIRLGASISSYWDAQAAGVPAYANVVGAHERPDGLLLLTFDVPVSLGGLEHFPGQIVQWTSGGGFASYAYQPEWPLSSQLRDFSLLPEAGAVPDGSAGPEPPLQITKSGADVTLSWGASCAADGDYAVYEGFLGFWNSRSPRLCSTSGATTATLTPDPSSVYYLVVPHNTIGEGSYGRDGSGAERVQGPGFCFPQALGACAAP